MVAPVNLAALDANALRKFVDSFDTILTDCDGVLLHAYIAIPGVDKTIQKLKELKKEIRFLSNNSSVGVEKLQKVLNHFGINAEKEDIIIPSLAIIHYLKSINFQKKVFIISFKSQRDQFTNAGIQIVDHVPSFIGENIEEIKLLLKDDLDIGAVIVDMDININYIKLMLASIYLQRPDVLFLVGASDQKISVNKNFSAIGPEYFNQILENFTDRKPMMFGKPSKYLGEYVKEIFKIKNPSRTLFIGDSLQQDMFFASECGFQKLFVLTGVNNLEEATCVQNNCQPDYYINSLGDLAQLLSNASITNEQEL